MTVVAGPTTTTAGTEAAVATAMEEAPALASRVETPEALQVLAMVATVQATVVPQTKMATKLAPPPNKQPNNKRSAHKRSAIVSTKP